VGANIKSEPDKKFLKRVEDAGYDYKLQHLNKDGNEIIRTLVGPFGTKTEAKNSLEGVQKSLNQNAFVLEIR